MDRAPEQLRIEAQLISAARELGPRLAERAYQADQDLRIPDETIAEMKAAGLFKILQPARWGGFEMDPRTFYKVQAVIAEYCMSTAWIYGVMGVHPWQIARYPMKTQEEIWGEDVNTLVASTYMPTAKVTPVEGGYQVSGRWGFSSCCEHSSWFLLGGIVPESDGRPPE
ncbi:MAG: flavin-dependent monooxygenase, partial [Betaproteobacteria bacterium]|nr:flavin-dependent monooxygenase [Betaproteobacteria bacterium]